MWLVCAPQHVSTIGHSLLPSLSSQELTCSSLSSSRPVSISLILTLPSFHPFQASLPFCLFCVHFHLPSSTRTYMAMAASNGDRSEHGSHPGNDTLMNHSERSLDLSNLNLQSTPHIMTQYFFPLCVYFRGNSIDSLEEGRGKSYKSGNK